MPPMSERRSSRGGRRRSFAGPEPLAKVLLRASGGEPRDSAPLPPRAWHDAVGDRIARRTRPMRLEHKVLTVRAATAVWAQELTFVAPTIIERLGALGFEVVSLRFKVGPVEAPDRPLRPAAVKAVPAQRPLPRELDRQLDRVADPKLRDTIARAASANLAWQAAARPARTATSAQPAAPAPPSAPRETAPPDRAQ